MVKSIAAAAIGGVLILVGILAGAVGGLFVYDAMGLPFTGIGVFDPTIEMNGKLFHVDAGMACFVLLSISVVTTTIGGMMVAASLTREMVVRK